MGDRLLTALLAVMGFMCLVLIFTPTPSALELKSFSAISNSLRLRRAGLRILDRQNPDVEVKVKDVRKGSTADPLDASIDAYWESRGVPKSW